MLSRDNVIIAMSFFLILTTSCTSSEQSTLQIENAQIMGTQNKNDSSATLAVIRGTLAYYQRIALPKNSIATITLSDVSIADRSAPVLASETIELLGKQVPIEFKLLVNRNKLKLGMFYSVRGKIVDSTGRLIWSTDTSHLIDPGKQENNLGMLKLIPGGQSRHEGKKLKLSLQNKEWLVENIAGNGVIDNSHTTLFFAKDGRVSGHSGCNKYTGFYSSGVNSLTIKNLVMTQRACVPALAKQEAKFLAFLETIVSFSIDNTYTLVLRNKHGGYILAR